MATHVSVGRVRSDGWANTVLAVIVVLGFAVAPLARVAAAPEYCEGDVSVAICGWQFTMRGPTRSNNAPNRSFAGELDAPGVAAKLRPVDYNIEDVRYGRTAVPRVYLAALPADLKRMSAIATRKALFIKAILPLILRANEEITSTRLRLMAIADRYRLQVPLLADDAAFLAELAMVYDVSGTAPADEMTILLERVDIVPPSLALAQAAEESGWGSSRFARSGNAVFGQRTFKPGEGMVPLRRDADKSHEVRTFNGLYASVRSYMRNLNTHAFYEEFRGRRATMRQHGQPLDAVFLVTTLHRYSERGGDYIETIRSIMRGNRLAQFDRARLHPPKSGAPPSGGRDS